jgi:hypothetical protein
LAPIEWFEALPNNPIYLVETQKRNGNVRLSELGVLAQAAAAKHPRQRDHRDRPFDGRTTLNLAMNAPQGSAYSRSTFRPTSRRNSSWRRENGCSSRKRFQASAFEMAAGHGRRKPPASCNCWGIPPRSTGRNISARRA